MPWLFVLEGMGKSNRKDALERKIRFLMGDRDSALFDIGRSERLIGVLPHLRERVWEIEKLIAACELVIKSDHPDWTIDHLKPSKQFVHKIPVRHGNASRLALDVLRTAKKPMLLREITIEVLLREGVHDPSPEVIEKVANTINRALADRLGTLLGNDGRKPARWWALPPAEIGESH